MALSALFVFSGCNDVVLEEGNQEIGYLSVSLGRDDAVISKAITEPSADMAFKVEVYKGNELVASTDDHRKLTELAPLTLRVGTYRVVASYGDNKTGFDAPYYVGVSENVVVERDKVTKSEIVCTLANVMVTVNFDETIKSNFKSYSVFVEDGTDKGGLTFSAGNLGATGYIPATGILEWELTLEKSDGTPYKTSGAYDKVQARQHFNLNFSLEEMEESGYGAIRLEVNDELIEQEFNLELDFSESELPSFSSNDGFNVTNQMSVIVGDESEKILTFTAAEGIRSMILAVDGNVATRSDVPMKWYELVEASDEVIAELAAKGIKTQSIAFGATSASVDMTEYISVLPPGNYNFDVTVYDTKGHVSECPIDFNVVSDFNAEITGVNPWAEFAVIKGDYFSETAPEAGIFMYRKASESSWKRFSSPLVCNAASKTFTGEIGGLDPECKYVIKAVSADEASAKEVEFTTAKAQTLYNMSFNDWYQDGKVWYPFAKGASPNVWDSANTATASFGGSSTTPEYSHVVSGTAARMESKYVVIAFAAGNIYTGNFGSINGLGAILDWGASFSSRPVALKGWYDYSPAAINRTKSPYDGLKGQKDKCQLMVLLTDWTEQFEINTTDGKFVDFDNDPNIIGYGKYQSDVTTGGYREFVIPIEYRNSRTPKYIVIVAASSYLGDYFTGGEGSTLYVDEFSLEYDVTRLTEEQKAKVNYR